MGTAITVNGSLNFPHDFQERDSSVFNNSIKITSIREEKPYDVYKKEIIVKSLLSHIDTIEKAGENWTEEDINAPNEYTINFSREIIPQLVENQFIPLRISQSAEEGICFVFNKNKLSFYFEVYNDKELGILVENFDDKKIIKNKEIHSGQELLNELTEFYNNL